jgi:hypothetical protein
MLRILALITTPFVATLNAAAALAAVAKPTITAVVYTVSGLAS